MALILLAAFIGLPLIEIWIFIEVGGRIGVLTTIGICVLTAVVGTVMIRAQGLATLMRVRRQMDEGLVPTREIFDGLCLLLAGAFLLTPGFVTDGLGFVLLVPSFRELLRATVSRHMAAHGRVHVDRGFHARRRRSGDNVTVIEGEFEEVDKKGGRDGRPGSLIDRD